MNYLIPANTKRGKLILGFFKPMDLFILAGGILVTLLLMATSEMTSPIITILVLSPAIICGFLVLPVPYYHNVLVYLQEMYRYYSNPRRYYWRGWCAWYDGESDKKTEGKR